MTSDSDCFSYKGSGTRGFSTFTGTAPDAFSSETMAGTFAESGAVSTGDSQSNAWVMNPDGSWRQSQIKTTQSGSISSDTETHYSDTQASVCSMYQSGSTRVDSDHESSAYSFGRTTIQDFAANGAMTLSGSGGGSGMASGTASHSFASQSSQGGSGGGGPASSSSENSDQSYGYAESWTQSAGSAAEFTRDGTAAGTWSSDYSALDSGGHVLYDSPSSGSGSKAITAPSFQYRYDPCGQSSSFCLGAAGYGSDGYNMGNNPASFAGQRSIGGAWSAGTAASTTSSSSSGGDGAMGACADGGGTDSTLGDGASSQADATSPEGYTPSPSLPDDPYSPPSVSRRQSDLRRSLGLDPDPESPIPDQGPGRNTKGIHRAGPGTPHDGGERNVNPNEEHSRVAKGQGGRGVRYGFIDAEAAGLTPLGLASAATMLGGAWAAIAGAADALDTDTMMTEELQRSRSLDHRDEMIREQIERKQQQYMEELCDWHNRRRIAPGDPNAATV